MYYRFNNLKIRFPWKHPDTGVKYPAGWFDDKDDLTPWGVTRHPAPVVPEFNPDTERLIELPSGELTVEPIPQEQLPDTTVYSVTMRQARLALLGAGLLDAVDAAIAAITDPAQRKAAEIEWEYAQTVDRYSPFTQQLAMGLGLTSEQLNSLFTQAILL